MTNRRPTLCVVAGPNGSVYDNSIDDQLPRLLYRTIDGELFKGHTEEIPNWAQTII